MIRADRLNHENEGPPMRKNHGHQLAARLGMLLGVACCVADGRDAGAEVFRITISGSVNTYGDTVMGLSGPAVPYSIVLDYDSALEPTPGFFPAGSVLPFTNVPTSHAWYGYSKQGLLAVKASFGDQTWSLNSVRTQIQPSTQWADVWFDTNIEAATPTRAMLVLDTLTNAPLPVGGMISLGVYYPFTGDLSRECYVLDRRTGGDAFGTGLTIARENLGFFEFAINRPVTFGGGGRSTDGTFTLNATMGQSFASEPVQSTDFRYKLSAGAWGRMSVSRDAASCIGDLNADRRIDVADLAAMLSNFGRVIAPGDRGDLDDSGLVDNTDLVMLLSRFGNRCQNL